MSQSYFEGSEALGKKILKGAPASITASSASSSKASSEIFLSEKEQLNKIEELIAGSFKSEAPLLSEISHYLLSLGGKRIRPMLCLLIARFVMGEGASSKEIPNKLLHSAAGIEIIHMATLLHDDIIDKAMTRRQSESAFQRFGQTPTLLTGDFLLVKAFGICARLEDSFVIAETENACVELTEGELLEGEITKDRTVELKDYYQIISKKTASLFALSGAVAAYFTSEEEKAVRQMRAFGEEAGILFQVVDDILDISVDKETLGKPGGIDLKQKVPTLINVLWLKEEPEKAREFFSKESYSDAEIENTKKYLLNSKVFELALNTAKKHHEKAQTILNDFSMNSISPVNKEAKDKLQKLLDYTISRIPQNKSLQNKD